MEQIVELLLVDKPDHSGVTYPLTVMEDAVKEINDRIDKKGGVLGECGIPIDLDAEGHRLLRIDLSRASHIVEYVWIDKAIVCAKVFLLGKYAEIADRMKIDFLAIPRAYGDIEKRVCTKYTLITVDIVLPE